MPEEFIRLPNVETDVLSQQLSSEPCHYLNVTGYLQIGECWVLS